MRNRHRRHRAGPTTPDVNACNRLHHTTFGYAKRSTSVDTKEKEQDKSEVRLHLSHPDLMSPSKHSYAHHEGNDTPQSKGSSSKSPRVPRSPSHTYTKNEMMEGTIETLQEDLLHLKSKYLHLQAHQRKTEQWAQYMEDRTLKAEQICGTMHKVLSDNESEKDRTKKTVLSTHLQAIKRILDKFNVVKGQSKWKKEAFVEEQKIITHRPEEEKASMRFEVRTEKYLFSDNHREGDRKHATSIPITESLYIDYMKELEVNAKVSRSRMLSALTSMASAKKDYTSLELERERSSKRSNNKYSTPRSSPNKDAAINVDDVFFNENAYNNIHDTHHHSHKRGSAYTDEDDNYEIEQPDISRVSKLLLKNCTECGCKYIMDKTIREQLRPTKLILKDSGYEYDISDEGDNFMQTERELTLAKAQVSAFKSHVKHLREEHARMQISLQMLKEKLLLDPEIEIWDREHKNNRGVFPPKRNEKPQSKQSAADYLQERIGGPAGESKFDDDDDGVEKGRMEINEAALQKLHSAMMGFSTTT